MSYSIVLKDRDGKQNAVVGRVWAASREEADKLARLLHPCQERQVLELRPGE